MKKLLITEIMDEQEVQKLQSMFTTIYDPNLFNNEKKIIELIPEMDALIVRNNTLVNETILAASKQLKVIGRLGVGLNNINVELCKKKNITIIPATGANTVSVAEYVISCMLLLSRKVFNATESVIAGDWPRNKFMHGLELYNQTLGIIGLGSIGKAVATRAKSFDMNIISYDPLIKESSSEFSYIQMKSLEEIFAQSDIITLHIPLNADTKNLINKDKIQLMKKGSILINTSRGEVVDENAVIENLKSDHLGGAALDVFNQEPLTKENANKFKDIPNLICTPHISGLSEQANKRVSSMIANSVMKFFSL